MRNIINMLIAILHIFNIFPEQIIAQQEFIPKRKLIVGTKEAPPFSMKSEDGTWKGISIDLWRKIANEMKLEFEFQEHDIKGLIDGIVDGALDVAVAALTITRDRERSFDFSHPFHSTGLSIATLSKYGNPWIAVFKRFFSTAFMGIVASLVFLLLIVGLFLWWFERKKNPEQFGGKAIKGIGSGFWWSAVTMTTVGYGDKAPVTFWGRILAIIWMFAGIISSFTAAITSALTVGHLESIINGPEDLPKVRVGTVVNSTSEVFLREKSLSYSKYNTLFEGLQDVADGKIDAVVYDAPILRYRLSDN